MVILNKKCIQNNTTLPGCHKNNLTFECLSNTNSSELPTCFMVKTYFGNNCEYCSDMLFAAHICLDL